VEDVDLDEVLRARVLDLVRARGRGDMLDDAIEAALAPDADSRGWSLVRLAAALRAKGDLERALLVLDGVDSLGASPGVRAAAFTCAAGVHCDRGDPGAARTAGELAHGLAPDEFTRKVLLRAYWELWTETRQREFFELWKRLEDDDASVDRAAAPGTEAAGA
jgi:hypothetical protein